MKMFKIAHYQIWESRSALITFYGIIVGIATLLTLSTYHFVQEAGNRASIGGLDFASVIFIFVMGIVSFKSSFKFMLANGNSRITFLKGHLLSIFPLTAVMAILDIIINRISNIFVVNHSFFSQIYLPKNSFENVTPNLIRNFIWSFAILSLFAIIGFCIALIYYRSNKIMRIVISIIPFAVINILGFLNGPSNTNGAIGNAIHHIWESIWGIPQHNPYIAVFSMSIGFICFTFVSFLLLRKAPVRD